MARAGAHKLVLFLSGHKMAASFAKNETTNWGNGQEASSFHVPLVTTQCLNAMEYRVGRSNMTSSYHVTQSDGKGDHGTLATKDIEHGFLGRY